ncbi:hypothetical protein DOTSEDRAFT_35782 [Dothistroma septosporum NZE10]|uniref:Uncharacterized protein n=1 Tax=Dothistroma septosporum (strain NZE10 / CBS 128990) TaxID=675120 RepID=M2YNG4_DOTSN|nr:hypothetical protein DOTSEDRAFT_35782 [Dothistroma septosporum NZE10]
MYVSKGMLQSQRTRRPPTPQHSGLKLRYEVLDIDKKDADTFDDHIRLIGCMIQNVLKHDGHRTATDYAISIPGRNGASGSNVTLASTNTIQLWWMLNYAGREELLGEVTMLPDILPLHFQSTIDNTRGSLDSTSIANLYARKQRTSK